MSRSGMLETKRAKLLLAVAVTLLLATFQIALQAKPAHAWEMKVSITGAGRVEETTPAHLLNCSTASTNPNGQLGATCLAGTPNGDYGNFWDVDYLATPAEGYAFKRWESDGTTRRAIICDRSTPPASTSTYSGSTVCKFRAVDNMQTRAVFADEQNPSQPSITNTTPARTNQAVSFDFPTPTDPTFRQFECRVTPTVQTSFRPCTSGVSFNPTADGPYTFEVQAVDWSGNRSSSASRSWTVDKTAPFPGINSGPSSFTWSNTNSATFTFSSTDATAFFDCSLDAGLFFTACSSPKSYTGLSDGQHTFYVRASDSVGNSSTNSRTWFIDTVVPETTLDPSVGPAANTPTQDNDPNFAFSSNEAQATFECSLTGPGMTSTAFTACSSPKGYTNLKDGTYTLKVRAKDRATNVDASPAERTWTINNTPTVLADSLTPAKGATGVSRTTAVDATFSEEMAPTSIANLTTHVSKTFKLQMYNAKKKKWIAVPATVDVTNSNTTAALDPYGATEGATEKPLAARKKFKATITTGVTDAQGNPIAKNFVWAFKTGSI